MADLNLLTDWLALVIRWIHVIAGIAWIGASFYFNWLEGNLERQGKAPELAGDLWAVHGGGFYHVQKLKSAPTVLPGILHWFKWEAYLTWLSGMALLAIVYYLNAGAWLPRAGASFPDANTGIALGTGTLLAGWTVYHLLGKTRLIDRPLIFGILIFCLITLTAWGLVQVFNGRAAYIHTGALIGTIMVGNVFFVIIPAQKQMVTAARRGEPPPNPRLAVLAGRRSLHNNYFTLPVLFIMISSHYPATYDGPLAWLTLALIAVAGIIVRHGFNLKNQRRTWRWFLPVAALIMLGIAMVRSRPVPAADSASAAAEQLTEIGAMALIDRHCRSCHAARPTDPAWPVAPGGLILDHTDAVRARASVIHQRVVVVRNMPFGNKSGMTPAERTALGTWLLSLQKEAP